MCVVSMVGDHYKPQWPEPNEIDWTTVNFGPAQEKTALDLFDELTAIAKKLDAVLGLPDCEDPEKRTWLDEVRSRVREHEWQRIEDRLGGDGG